MINDIDMNGRFSLVLSDHSASPGPDDPFTDWVYWHLPVDQSPGDKGYQDWLARAQTGDGSHRGEVTIGRMSLMNWNGTNGSPIAPNVVTAWMPEPGTTFRIKTNAAVEPGDTFSLSTGSLVLDVPEEELVPRIGITPNPYKTASLYEVSSQTDEVRFTNMPETATIRIFQVGGTLVRTLKKNNPDRHFTWDLRTSENLPIASGMYLIHVDTEEGEQVLKFGVIKKQALLNSY